MSDTQDVEIRVFASPQAYARRDAQDEPRVAEVIRQHVLPRSAAEYYRVDVKIVRKSDHTPQYLVAYLLRKDIYLAEVVRVDVDSGYQVTGTRWRYDESTEEREQEFSRGGVEEYACPYDFVAATPVPDIASAKAAVESLHNLAISVGLRSKMLLSPEATVANYKQYLTCGLQGFVNVGHGNPNGIVLHDGVLDASWFNSITTQALNPPWSISTHVRCTTSR